MGATFRIAAGTAKVNGSWLSPIQTDFTIGTELTASTMNYIFLKTDGTYAVTTNRTTGPANSLLLYEVFTNATIVVGYNFPTRVFASNAFNSAEVEVVVDATGYGHTTDPLLALNYLPSTGGKIRIRPGTYTLSSTWTINKEVLIEAERGSAIIKMANSANLTNLITINASASCVITGLVFDGNKANQTSTLFDYDGLIRCITATTLINCESFDHKGSGYDLSDGCMLQNCNSFNHDFVGVYV